MSLNKISINDTTTVNTGIVYDISKAHNGATYTDLADALSGNNVPPEIREGGMTVRFVSNSDNKYVQYRLMLSTFNTTPSNWQGVDNEPTAKSDNLVKSGGVFSRFSEINDIILIKDEALPTDGVIDKAYLNISGLITQIDDSGFKVAYYEVTPLTNYILSVFGSAQAMFAQCAFYSALPFESNTLISYLPKKNTSDDNLIVKVPEGANYIVVNRFSGKGFCYNSKGINQSVNDINTDIINLSDKTFNYLGISDNDLVNINLTTHVGLINKEGNIESSATDYIYSSPIYLYAGYYMLKGAGYSDIVALFSETDVDGSYYKPLLTDNSLLWQYPTKTYILYLPSSRYVAISTRNVEGWYLKKIEQFTGILQVIPDKFKVQDTFNAIELYQEPISLNGKLDDKFIDSNANISNSQGFYVYYYDITAFNSEKILIKNSLHAGISLSYAVYNSLEFSNTTVVKKGPSVTSQSSDYYFVDIPSNAKYLGVSFASGNSVEVFSFSKINEKVIELQEKTSTLVQACSNFTKKYAYQFDGANLYIAYNDGNGKETCFWFERCMTNELFTFYSVGYRTVDYIIPSTEGISTWSNITTINNAGSDNIGPVCVNIGSSSWWIGGNHLYPNNDVEKTYKTAQTISYSVYVNGTQINNGFGIADNITIKVKNIIFNPSYAPSTTDASLSHPMIDEYVTYVINKKTIEVGLRHEYKSDADGTIRLYLGMQSNCGGDYILTPNGQFSDWTLVEPLTAELSFTKGDYPNFNRFIEKISSKGCYQSTFLIPNFSLGTHSKLSNNDEIFNRTVYKKAYHRLLENFVITDGMTYQWAGSYTFFTDAILDNEYVFAYMGSVRSKDVLFINAKQAFSGEVAIPSEFALKKISIIENTGFVNEDGGTDFGIGNGIFIKSDGVASMIIEFL